MANYREDSSSIRRSSTNRSPERRQRYRPEGKDSYNERERGASPRRGDSRRDNRGYERREYQERDRERERQKDRERYDSTRDGEYGRSSRSNRRSASPRSRPRSRPRSTSQDQDGSPKPEKEKAKPNFGQSGLLAAETNTVQAVDGSTTVLKYNEPPEARKPTQSWRLYVFKGSEQMELLHIQRQSAYLIGRDQLVADIAIEHPSCSKQHAVIQYRYVQETRGDSKGIVKPFIIDLESTNGTLVNDEKIPAARFYELKTGDVIKFGLSTREYVLLNEEAAS